MFLTSLVWCLFINSSPLRTGILACLFECFSSKARSFIWSLVQLVVLLKKPRENRKMCWVLFVMGIKSAYRGEGWMTDSAQWGWDIMTHSKRENFFSNRTKPTFFPCLYFYHLIPYLQGVWCVRNRQSRTNSLQIFAWGDSFWWIINMACQCIQRVTEDRYFTNSDFSQTFVW